MIKGRDTGSTQLKKSQMTLKENMFLKSGLQLHWLKMSREELVFALFNREIIEAMWGQLIGSSESE